MYKKYMHILYIHMLKYLDHDCYKNIIGIFHKCLNLYVSLFSLFL